MTTELSRSMLALAAVLLTALCLLLIQWNTRQERFEARIRLVRSARAGGAAAGLASEGSVALGFVRSLGDALIRSRLLSRNTLSALERTLVADGFRGDRALGLFVGAKVLLLLALPAATLLLADVLGTASRWRTMLMFAAAILGLLTPDAVVRRQRRHYLRDVEEGLPDALDLMVICSEAGIGLEAAMARVATEIRPAHRAVAAELAMTVGELKLAADRRAALVALGERTGVESLRRLAATLAQTVRYGTPLSRALRTLAAEMRQEQATRFEARAARLPVLLTVPMIVFILPTVFLIVAGPAALQVLSLR